MADAGVMPRSVRQRQHIRESVVEHAPVREVEIEQLERRVRILPFGQTGTLHHFHNPFLQRHPKRFRQSGHDESDAVYPTVYIGGRDFGVSTKTKTYARSVTKVQRFVFRQTNV